MRRPLVVIFLCFSTGILLAWYGQEVMGKLFFFGTICSGMILVFLNLRASPLLPAMLVAIASLLTGMVVMDLELLRPEPLLDYVGEEVSVVGDVIREKETAYGRSLLIQPVTDEAGRREWLSRRRIWVYVNGSETESADSFAPQRSWSGWRIRFYGTVERPEFPRNPGAFDQETYLRTLGVQAVFEVDLERLEVLEDSTDLSARFRSLLKQRWEPAMGERSCGGIMGLLFGTSEDMEDATLEAFQKIGLGHLLAVSGLHVGLVYGAVQKLLGERGTTLTAQGICCIAVILYAALAGFSASACRAALMIVIHSIGRTIFRPYDMLTSASLAGLLLLSRQPCQILSSGFQLSMIAAFGLAGVLPRISYSMELWADKKRSHSLRWLAQNVSPMMAIQLVMGPICARQFHCVSLWSLLLNPVCIAAAGMLIPMALGLSFVTLLLEWMGRWSETAVLEFLFLGFSRLTGSVMDGIMNSGEIAAGFPGTFVVASLPPGMLLLYYGSLFTLCSESFYILLRKHRKKEIRFWIVTLLIASHICPWAIGASTSPSLFSYQDYPVVFVDVGQGDCIHIQTPKGKNVLIDGGGSSRKNVGEDTLLPYLLHRGVGSIDLAFATHLHQDHFQGIVELAEVIPVKQLGIYEANCRREQTVKERFSDPPEFVYLKEGSRIQLEEDIWIDVLAPPQRSQREYERLAEDDSDENDSCLIFMVHYGDLEMIVTGDMGMEGEGELLAKNVPMAAEILKVGHHGSKYSTSEDFLRAVSPEVAVISVGANYFGHPSDRVIELLEKNDIIVGRTDLHGAVIVSRIGKEQAEIISRNGEQKWRIDLRENQ